MTSVLITGTNGQLGQEFKALAPIFTQTNFHFFPRKILDITSETAVRKILQERPYDWCINCAAYTKVDQAEREASQATAVNVRGVANLAAAAAAANCGLIHFSTDYVYHADQNWPYRETDSTNPKSVYAKTKLRGEERARSLNPNTIVIRTSWLYSSFGHNFVKTMLRLGKQRKELKVVFDQVGTPTYARDLATTTLNIIDKWAVSGEPLNGIYHFSNEGVTSWYDFAKAIFDICAIDCKVLPIESKDYPTAAERPKYSVLNKEKIKALLSKEIPHWRDSLVNCIKLL